MTFNENISRLKESKIFLEWQKEHVDAYLTHCFFMKDKMVEPEWQIGYYNPGTDLISTFVIGEKIIMNPDSEALKKEGMVDKLDISKVKKDYVDAFELANKVQVEEFKTHTPMKKIFILQNIEGKQIWNVTYVTNTFNTLNIKIDSETGEINSKKLLSIFKVEK